MDSSDLKKIRLYETSLPYASVKIQGENLIFAVPNEKCLFFASTIASREPDTLAWLDDLTPADIFFDVGANNLVFSLIAAKLYRTPTFAFEPHFASYYVAQLNVLANQLDDLISVYPISLNSELALNYLYLSGVTAGKSLNSFGIKSDSTDPLWSTKASQASIAMSLDTICDSLGRTPTVLKIDVDGLESNIVTGGIRSLRSSKIRKLMIEFNPSNEADISADRLLLKEGYTLDFAGPSGYFYKRRNL
jgi:FkbM family methyltransferase